MNSNEWNIWKIIFPIYTQKLYTHSHDIDRKMAPTSDRENVQENI